MNPQQKAWETRRITHAISIRQPWAELIMRGVKVREFRSVPTNIRGRVYVYAGLNPRPPHEYAEFGLKREDLITGVLIGTVEVVDCEQIYPLDTEEFHGCQFAYVLANPRRLSRPIKPDKRAQPIWFRPFGE